MIRHGRIARNLAMSMWEVANGKILVLLYVRWYEPCTLRLSNHINAQQFFGFCLKVFCQAGPFLVLCSLIY